MPKKDRHNIRAVMRPGDGVSKVVKSHDTKL
jgi:hypothetical protein